MDIKKLIEKPSIEIVILFATLFLFIITDRLLPESEEWWSLIPPVLGVLVVLEMLFIVGMEVKVNTKKHGWKHEIIDTVVALVVALIIWFSAVFILDTPTPVSGVVSCSMLPNLYRGDFVILQGAEPTGYEIEMSKADFQKLHSSQSMIFYPEGNRTITGSLYSYCHSMFDSTLCNNFMDSPSSYVEVHGPFTYHYTECFMNMDDGSQYATPCLESIDYKGQKYLTNFSNDVIVYQPPLTDFYGRVGDIVHRVFFKINVGGELYYVTRGDNNPILDIQAFDYVTYMGNNPIPEQNLRGKVILRVPILGYFKLLISGFLKEDEQCKWQLQYEHIE